MTIEYATAALLVPSIPRVSRRLVSFNVTGQFQLLPVVTVLVVVAQ